jgi:hypothetical protein
VIHLRDIPFAVEFSVICDPPAGRLPPDLI